MAWFDPAWQQLSEEEQCLLESVYLDGSERVDICARLGFEKDAYYKRRNRALAHLTTLLYGVM